MWRGLHDAAIRAAIIDWEGASIDLEIGRAGGAARRIRATGVTHLGLPTQVGVGGRVTLRRLGTVLDASCREGDGAAGGYHVRLRLFEGGVVEFDARSIEIDGDE